jgi:hypothetical protein
VLDGIESSPNTRLWHQSMYFVNDGRLVYSAFDSGGWTSFIGSGRIPGRRLRAITPDGAHRAYFLSDSDSTLMVDQSRAGEAWANVPSQTYSIPGGVGILQSGARSELFSFDGDAGFHLYYLLGNRLWRSDGKW